MNVYVYNYQGDTVVYKSMDKAFERLLKDVGYDNLQEYVEDCREYGVWVDYDDHQFVVDDGGPSIELSELVE